MNLTKRSYKFKKIFFNAILIFFFFSHQGMAQIIEPTKKAIEEKIVHAFNDKKIIMLADFEHSNALPKKSVIDLLRKWESMIQNNNCRNLKLTLVLEEGDYNINIISKYIQSGNWGVFKKYRYLHRVILSTLEFFAQLKEFSRKIKKINKKRKKNNLIEFRIIGGEYNPPDVQKTALGGTANESMRWFVYKRDYDSAKKIIRYTKKFPGHKLLVFYGSAHLAKIRSLKASRSTGSPENLYGYWLAYHLKKHYGKKNVLSIQQICLPHRLEMLKKANRQELLRKLNSYSQIKKSVLISDPSFPWTNGYDRVILRIEKRVPKYLLYLLFSGRTPSFITSEILYFKRFLPGKWASSAIKSCLIFPEIILGKNFKSADSYLNQYKSGQMKIFTRFFKEKLYKQLHKRYRKFRKNPRLLLRLIQVLGFNKEVSNEVLHHSWRKKSLGIWKKAENNFRLLQAIGLNWIGLPKEKRWAKRHLIKVTGINYKKPHLYLKWWRKNRYGVNY